MLHDPARKQNCRRATATQADYCLAKREADLMSITRRTVLRSGAWLGATAWSGAAHSVDRPARPLVLGHRGCSALRPEHTLGSYAKAIVDGADFIEPDLVPTRDGVLVARHEPNITETTDIADHTEFAKRKTVRTIDGARQEGWFTHDFTLAELKTLRATERLGAMRPESGSYNGQFQIVTFQEIADFVAAESAARGRTVGLIPEIKHSTYFAAAGFAMENLFLEQIAASPYLRRAPIIVQSFETANLKRLHAKLAGAPNIGLMQLTGDDAARPADVVAAGGALTFGAMLTPAGLAGIATYADWVAPQSKRIIPLGSDGRLGKATTLAADAHRAGLLLGCYTFRPENHFLARDFRDDKGDGTRNPVGSVAEIRCYLAEGLDAFFTDDPAIGRRAVDGG
jgi:glycerophosphoryl diester phosphodiesterase